MKWKQHRTLAVCAPTARAAPPCWDQGAFDGSHRQTGLYPQGGGGTQDTAWQGKGGLPTDVRKLTLVIVMPHFLFLLFFCFFLLLLFVLFWGFLFVLFLCFVLFFCFFLFLFCINTIVLFILFLFISVAYIMCVCVCVCVCVRCTHAHVFVSLLVYICIYNYLYIGMCIWTHAFVCTCM